jgi:hypothetical protein
MALKTIDILIESAYIHIREYQVYINLRDRRRAGWRLATKKGGFAKPSNQLPYYLQSMMRQEESYYV